MSNSLAVLEESHIPDRDANCDQLVFRGIVPQIQEVPRPQDAFDEDDPRRQDHQYADARLGAKKIDAADEHHYDGKIAKPRESGNGSKHTFAVTRTIADRDEGQNALGCWSMVMRVS